MGTVSLKDVNLGDMFFLVFCGRGTVWNDNNVLRVLASRGKHTLCVFAVCDAVCALPVVLRVLLGCGTPLPFCRCRVEIFL